MPVTKPQRSRYRLLLLLCLATPLVGGCPAKTGGSSPAPDLSRGSIDLSIPIDLAVGGVDGGSMDQAGAGRDAQTAMDQSAAMMDQAQALDLVVRTDLSPGIDQSIGDIAVPDLQAPTDQSTRPDQATQDLRTDAAQPPVDMNCPALATLDSTKGFVNGNSINLQNNVEVAVPPMSPVSVTTQTAPVGAVSTVRLFYAARADYVGMQELVLKYDVNANPKPPPGKEQWYGIIDGQPQGTQIWFWIKAEGCDGSFQPDPKGGIGNNFRFRAQ